MTIYLLTVIVSLAWWVWVILAKGADYYFEDMPIKAALLITGLAFIWPMFILVMLYIMNKDKLVKFTSFYRKGSKQDDT